MTETTETTERTPAEWCDVLADEAAASVALAASERDNVARHARLAAEAKQRGAMVDAADAASAAAAYARGAREAAIAAVAACNDVEATMRSFDVIGQAAGDEITPDVRAELDRIRAT
jgi:hypothetical protein